MRHLHLGTTCLLPFAVALAMQEPPINFAYQEKTFVALLLKPTTFVRHIRMQTGLTQARAYMRRQTPGVQAHLQNVLDVYIRDVWPYAIGLLEPKNFRAREIYQMHEFLDNLIPLLVEKNVSTDCAKEIATILRTRFQDCLDRNRLGQTSLAISALEQAADPRLWRNVKNTAIVFETALTAIAWLGHSCAGADRLMTNTIGLCQQSTSDGIEQAQRNELVDAAHATITCVKDLVHIAGRAYTPRARTSDVTIIPDTFHLLTTFADEQFELAHAAKTPAGQAAHLEASIAALITSNSLFIDEPEKARAEATVLLQLAKKSLVQLPTATPELVGPYLTIIKHAIGIGLALLYFVEEGSLFVHDRHLRGVWHQCIKVADSIPPMQLMRARLRSTILAAEKLSKHLILAHADNQKASALLPMAYEALLSTMLAVPGAHEHASEI